MPSAIVKGNISRHDTTCEEKLSKQTKYQMIPNQTHKHLEIKNTELITIHQLPKTINLR